MRFFTLFLLYFFVSIQTYSQSSYFPISLGDSINSEYDEINPVLSPDEKTMFFVRVNHPENTFGSLDSQDIWSSDLINDTTWSKATRISNLNIARYNAVLSVFDDGKAILLNGEYNKNATIWRKRGFSISYKYEGNWTTPKRIKIKGFSRINRGMKSSGFMSSDGNYLILSFSKVFNGYNNHLFLSERNKKGVWGRPIKIKNLSSSRSEDTPFLSDDNSTIFFTSDRLRKHQFDIYKSEKLNEDWESWADPILLSDTIISPAWESDFKTNKKGTWAYFSTDDLQKRTTNINNETSYNPIFYGNADIYTVKLIEENPFVIVSGTVINKKTKKPLINREFTILVGGKPMDSVKVNTDSATYKLKLPLGKLYTLSPSIEGFQATDTELDVSNVVDFSQRTVDLLATPPSFVIVKGRILVQKTNLPISSSLSPTVTVNNNPEKSLKLNLVKSTYELKLKIGDVYNVSAKVKRHESIPKQLDLRKINDFSDIVMDLYVTQEKLATVRGKIIDKKTNRIFAKLSQAKINVEGFLSFISSIDTLTGRYELKLPLASSYTINASAPNYFPIYESLYIGNQNTEVIIYKDLVIAPVEVGQSIRLNNIFFDTGKATLKPSSFPELNRVVEYLFKAAPSLIIEISGHTDNVGSSSLNNKLSLNRARSVTNYLVREGIGRGRLFAKGYGSTKPVASNKYKAGRAKNRRVEFKVIRN